MKCNDCKVTWDNSAFKYCPLCGKQLEIIITYPTYIPYQPNPLLPEPYYPWWGDPYMPHPATPPNTHTFIHRTLRGENGEISC